MTKLQAILLSILFVLMTSKVFASNPMMQVAQVNPIPMLMPILVKQATVLELTEEQVKAFALWRSENMAPAVKASMTIRNAEKSIKQASLDGTPVVEIEALLEQVAQARAGLAARTLRCHSYAKGILSAKQWQNLIDLYSKS